MKIRRNRAAAVALSAVLGLGLAACADNDAETDPAEEVEDGVEEVEEGVEDGAEEVEDEAEDMEEEMEDEG